MQALIRHRAMTRTAYAAAAILLCSTSVSSSQTHTHSHQVTPDLPDAPERTLVMRYCIACHPLDRVRHSGGTAAGWEDRIQRMIRWGAEIEPGQIAAVAAYLAKALPVRLRPAASLSFFANTAVSETAVQSIQTTVRAAATFDAARRRFSVRLDTGDAQLLKVGARARAFAPDSHALAIPSKIVGLQHRVDGYWATAEALAPVPEPQAAYVIEMIIEQGRYLAIPNEALIDEGDGQFVYVQDAGGEYLQRAVKTGLQGESFTQVLAGVSAGEQVVTLGGFFIDAEYKMKSSN